MNHDLGSHWEFWMGYLTFPRESTCFLIRGQHGITQNIHVLNGQDFQNLGAAMRTSCVDGKTNDQVSNHLINCECGMVSMQISDRINDFSHCHCSQCRRIHGSAFATFAGTSKAGFKILRGHDCLKSYNSSEKYTRFFCKNCGSKLFIEITDEPDQIYFAMGLINDKPIDLPDAYHIYVGSKAFWHTINSNETQYKTEP